MDDGHPLSTPMEVQSLYPKNDLFCPKEVDEEIFGLKVLDLNDMYVLPDLAQ